MKTESKRRPAVEMLTGLFFFMLIGVLTGVVVIAFKGAASAVIAVSETCYSYVWAHPGWLPILIFGTALLGWGASKTAKMLGNCSGGGIPTAIAAIRGLIKFSGRKNLFIVFGSAMVTYLGGVPLGNEGPSVQMGTAVGKAVFGWNKNNNPEREKQMMLVGASAGFAAATCAPLTGILFAFEEARCKWSLRSLLYVSLGAVSAVLTSRTLGRFLGISGRLFEFVVDYIMPMNELWSAAVVGIVCGLFAIWFTRMHCVVGAWVRMHLAEMSPTAQKCSLFAAVAVIGFMFHEVTGSGHHLIEALLEGHGIWLLLVLCLFLRALFLLVANNIGITGGIFVPTLAIGAMLGALCARPLAAVGAISPEAVSTLIIVGTVAFLAASSHIPKMAVLLAIEAFSGILYFVPALLGIGLAYVVVRIGKAEDFSELVVERKAEAERRFLQSEKK